MTIQPPLALVVEDDQLQRSALAGVLRDRGFDVIECESEEAGELVLARVGLELSVLVTDVDLGEGPSGLECGRSLFRAGLEFLDPTTCTF
jgi:ActR/RegA family two-component response regulator